MDKVKGIARYPHLMRADAPRGADKKRYSIDVLVAKTDPLGQQLATHYQQVVANSFPSGKPAGFNDAFEDLAITEPANTQLAGYYCLKCTTAEEFGQPALFDMQGQPPMDPALDSNLKGQVVWVNIGFGGYNKAGNIGVKCYLNGVLITGEMGPFDPTQLGGADRSVGGMFGDVVGGVVSPAAVPAPVPTAAAVPAPVPTAPQPPAVPVPVAAKQMTAAANGATYESMIAAGWTDEMLIQHGMMLPPGGVAPAFMG